MAACDRAGRYREQCWMHLLRSYAGHLFRARSPVDGAQDWARIVALAHPDPAFEDRAWSLLYRLGLESVEVVDDRYCAELPADQAAHCHSGHAEEVVRRIRRAVHGQGDARLREACHADDRAARAAAIEAASGVRYHPSDGLDAYVREALEAACRRPG